MSFMPDNAPARGELRRSFLGKVEQFFDRPAHARQFSPGKTLADDPAIDPRFKPRVPMGNEHIDPALMLECRASGFTNLREITALTHPELYAGWQELCRRAGHAHPTQLILADSSIPNALTVSDKEVIVTTGLFKLLNLRESLAVLGHELAHIKHDVRSTMRQDAQLVAGGIGGLLGAGLGGIIKSRFAPGVSLIDPLTQRGWKLRPMHSIKEFLFGVLQGGLALAGIGIGWIIARQGTVKPSELRADIDGAAISGDPQGLIAALQKMERLASRPGMAGLLDQLRTGYPSMTERIAGLRKLPAQEPVAYHAAERLAAAHPSAKVHAVAGTQRVEDAAQAPALG